MSGAIERMGKVLSSLDEQLRSLDSKGGGVSISISGGGESTVILIKASHLREAVLKERQDVHAEMVSVAKELTGALDATKDTIMHNALPGFEEKGEGDEK
jgi:hypothetical protein